MHRPRTLRLGSRDLVVFAGLPGAGKSTVLARLSGYNDINSRWRVALLDSQEVHDLMRRIMPRRVPYRWYRGLVHAVHRARIAIACVRSPHPVLAHEPATRASTRALLVMLGILTGRRRTFIWLQVPPDVAAAGQRTRHRTLRARSFRRHSRRGQALYRKLSGGARPHGWQHAEIITRDDVRRGLELEFD